MGCSSSGISALSVRVLSIYLSLQVILALLVALFIPESPKNYASPGGNRKGSKDLERATDRDSPTVLVPVPGILSRIDAGIAGATTNGSGPRTDYTI